MPLSGRGAALYQPIWAEDVADCVMAALAQGAGAARALRAGRPADALAPRDRRARAAAAGRPRPIVSVPSPVVNRVLRAAEVLLKSRAPATWDEAELLEVSMTSAAGTADVVGARDHAAADGRRAGPHGAGAGAGRALTAAPTASVRPTTYGIATTAWPVSGWNATRLPRATITLGGDSRSTVNGAAAAPHGRVRRGAQRVAACDSTARPRHRDRAVGPGGDVVEHRAALARDDARG